MAALAPLLEEPGTGTLLPMPATGLVRGRSRAMQNGNLRCSAYSYQLVFEWLLHPDSRLRRLFHTLFDTHTHSIRVFLCVPCRWCSVMTHHT